MTAFAFRLALGALLCLIPPAARAQTAAPEQAAAPAAPAAPAQNLLSQQQLQQLAAPIALYPDNLLAQVLMASTYPLEVVEAARWSQSHRNLAGPALQQALQQEPWDPSVKSLTAFPQVIKMLSDQLDWTQKLGDAFLAQQQDMLQAVQTLREKAQGTGALKTVSQQAVSASQSDGKTYVTIQPSDPQTVYVPVYNPATVYGPWPYPALPPYTFAAQPASYWPGAGAIGFGAGIAAGAALWGACNWPHGAVAINTGNFNAFNNANLVNPDWRHNPEHRLGVPYVNHNLAQQYGRAGADQAARDAFRGRIGSGQPLFPGRAAQGPLKQDLAGARGHAFEGVGNGADIRRQSERGRESRARSLERQREFARPRPEHLSPERAVGGPRFAGRRGHFGGRRR